jgi:catechol 2,3-dioxygenase-like lactoylglutathione lyase family enzyme
MATVLRLQHTSIPMPADGHARARAFFGDALGMREVPPPKELDVPNLVWFLAGDDGHEIHLFVDPSLAAMSAAQHLCLQVDDVDAFRARLAKHGVEIEETTEIPSRPRFFVHDPFRNFIEIAQITGDYT